LAICWLLFGGDWQRITTALDDGSAMPCCGLELTLMGAFHRGDAGVVNPDAANELLRRLRLGRSQDGRVVARGLLHGQGAMAEIDPVELVTFEWAENPDRAHGAVLERHNGTFYSNVLIEAASVMAAFSPSGPVKVSNPKSKRPSAAKWFAHGGEDEVIETLKAEGTNLTARAIARRAAEIWKQKHPDAAITTDAFKKAGQRMQATKSGSGARRGQGD
jgi:hypothetical protein